MSEKLFNLVNNYYFSRKNCEYLGQVGEGVGWL